ALIFVSVGSLALMAVLALVDVSMRSTTQLTSQDSTTAEAEGAANIAINAVRNKSFGLPAGAPAGTDPCSDATYPLSLPEFYQRLDGTKDSARVTCELDTASTVGTPAKGLVTLDQAAPLPLIGPWGIWVTDTASSGTGSFSVTGDVQSN